jgi:hypothetical protein
MRKIIMNIPTAKWILGLGASLAILLVVGVGLGAVSAQEGGDQIQIYGSGEATAAPWVTYDTLAGGVKDVGSNLTKKGGEDTTGNRFTFAFNVVKDAEGKVEGKIIWRDLDLDVVVEGKPVSVKPHPSRAAPTGFSGIIYQIIGVTTKEVTIGKTTFPVGSTIRNSPVFDGGTGGHSGNTVCFEIFLKETIVGVEKDVKVYQWSAYVSGGNVEVIRAR